MSRQSLQERLTVDDLDLLEALADGKQLPDVAKLTGRTLDAVKSHAHRCRAKFNSLTTVNMVATALRRGLIK